MNAINKESFRTYLHGVEVDYFISSASFEDRCLGVCLALDYSTIKKSAIFGTTDFHEKVEERRHRMIELCRPSAVESIDLKIDDPVFSFVQMANFCSQIFIDDAKNVLLDITTFTHEGLLMLFRLLYLGKRNQDKILISYIGAKTYSANETDSEDKWLTKGVKGTRSIIGYPGYFEPSQKNHLIILVGFEKERTIKLIEEFDFDIVTLAFGSKSDSISGVHQNLNEQKHKEVTEIFSTAQKLEISLTDPFVVKTQILNHIKLYPYYNTVIAPMNNKISTIGAGLAAIDNQDIQLFYMQANVYNVDSYSEAGDDFYLIEV